MKAKPCFQQEYEEASGLLLGIHEAEGFCIAYFSWGAFALPLSLRDKLWELQGKKISILKLEGYHIRKIEE